MSSETCARYGERARQCTEAGELLVLVQALGTHHNAVDKQHAPDAVPTHPNVAITQNQHQCAAHASPAPQRSVSCDSRRTRKSTGLFCADATAANATRPAAPTATTIVLLCTCPNSPDWGQGLRSTSACAPYSYSTHTHTQACVFYGVRQEEDFRCCIPRHVFSGHSREPPGGSECSPQATHGIYRSAAIFVTQITELVCMMRPAPLSAARIQACGWLKWLLPFAHAATDRPRMQARVSPQDSLTHPEATNA
jgi:hypothetical protein